MVGSNKQDFTQKISLSKLCKRMRVRQKVPKLHLQSQFLTSKIGGIFLFFFH